MSSLVGRDVKGVITALAKLKNHRHKKHPQRKDNDIDALSAKGVRHDLEATLPHLGFPAEEKPSLSTQQRGGISNCEV